MSTCMQLDVTDHGSNGPRTCHSSERKSARTLLKLRLPRLPLIEVIATDDPCLPLIEVVLVGAIGRG